MKQTKVNGNAKCAKGEIVHAEGYTTLGGSVCAGCGKRFVGHGMRAINAHHRAAKRRVAKETSRYIACETYPGYMHHLREIGDVPPNFGGHVVKPMSLCGRPIAWDTHLPVKGFHECARCAAELSLRIGGEQ